MNERIQLEVNSLRSEEKAHPNYLPSSYSGPDDLMDSRYNHLDLC